jgi:hypothetical protein
VALSPEVRATVYTLYNKYEVDMAYTYICIKANSNKVIVTSTVLRQDEMREIKKSILYTEEGIRRQVKTMNLWNCKECKQCQSL